MYRNNVDQLTEWIEYADKQTIARASHGMNVANPGGVQPRYPGFR